MYSITPLVTRRADLCPAERGPREAIPCYSILLMGFYLSQQIQELFSYHYSLIFMGHLIFVFISIHYLLSALSPFPKEPALYLRWFLRAASERLAQV